MIERYRSRRFPVEATATGAGRRGPMPGGWRRWAAGVRRGVRAGWAGVGSRRAGWWRGRALVRLVLELGSCAVVAVLSATLGAGAVLVDRADGLIVADPGLLGRREVVIVPGARIDPDGEPGISVLNRLTAAADLFDRGLVGHILVSGDDRESRYNEPVAMRNWLVDEAGIDSADITLDYAGLDTWDTCRRAADQFLVTDAVVVTQQRHADRTAALCRAAGLDVRVLAVDDSPRSLPATLLAGVRERLAAVKAVVDLVTDRPPRHGGPAIGLVGSNGMPEGGHPPDWEYGTGVEPAD